jgi:hypothetical protein
MSTMSGQSDLHEFDSADGSMLRQGLPPIVGLEGGSAWFSNGGHAAIESPDFPAIAAGFYVLLDVQPDLLEPTTVLGSETTDASGLRVTLNDPSPGDIGLHMTDEAGRRLQAVAHGSVALGRRLVITGEPANNAIQIYEIQPWASSPGEGLPIEVIVGERPGEIRVRDWTVGGIRRDGALAAAFVGRIANIALGEKVLSPERVGELAAASRENPDALTAAGLGRPDHEIADLFLRDIDRLRSWSRLDSIDSNDRDDAAALIYRWLYSKHPVLRLVAKSLGAQTLFPGAQDPTAEALELILATQSLSVLASPERLDTNFSWRTLEEWSGQGLFRVGQKTVSREGFVKFVRNKLGVGHFDPEDRTKWQTDLLQEAGGLSIQGMDGLVFQMHAVIREVTLMVTVSRLEPTVRRLHADP